jgi:hypothetical protein
MTGDYMEYTIKSAAYRNQQITDNTRLIKTGCDADRPLLTPATVDLLLTCVCGVLRLTELLSHTKHPLAPHLVQDICPRRALLQ